MIKICNSCKIEFATNRYTQDYYQNLKNKFSGSDGIASNYSQSFQDIFVLQCFNGKTNGTYLEIGSGHFSELNNTYLLEKNYSWTGSSIDVDTSLVNLYNKNRKNKAYPIDATIHNYYTFIKENFSSNYIDYLQIDCDPAINSLSVLERIPFEDFSFGVITFEHDFYCDKDKYVKEKSREILSSYGYVLAVPNVCVVQGLPYEDWWINPLFVKNKFPSKDINKNVNILEYMIKDSFSKKSIFCNH